MFRAFKTSSFVISNNFSGSQRSAVRTRQMCISAQSRLHVFKLLVSIWFNIQTRWHTPAAENESLPETQLFKSSYNCSCATKQKKHTGASRQRSVSDFPPFLHFWNATGKHFEKWVLQKETKHRFIQRLLCVLGRKQTFQEGAILNFVQLQAELICSEQEEIPHAQIALIARASHQPQVGFGI